MLPGNACKHVALPHLIYIQSALLHLFTKHTVTTAELTAADPRQLPRQKELLGMTRLEAPFAHHPPQTRGIVRIFVFNCRV